jgi:hypothetical protein
VTDLGPPKGDLAHLADAAVDTNPVGAALPSHASTAAPPAQLGALPTGQLRQHPQGLCLQPEALCRFVPALQSFSRPRGSADRWLYITALASGTAERGARANSVSTIERRLSSLSWNYAQCGGQKLGRTDRHITTVMAGIRNTRAAPPRQKEAALPEHLIAMLEPSIAPPCVAYATAPCC